MHYENLLPPSYDEYLAQKMQGLGGIGSSGSGASSMVPPGGGPPYSWRPCDHRDGGNIVPTPAPFPLSTPSRISQQNVSRAMASSYEPNQGQQGQHCCTCSKCKTRYGYYDDNSGNDVLFTLETQTAMQGILTDGVALCCMM
ncbi:hypothetical protein J437_LFUL000945 [Ladona fulva]|uniref:Uncharacterized protein n=1 Tax=Ladona fulva TaxID=123851 RepID=A0A8K0K8D7_LADFU|nr:hypothetical protein J437_LFUL000945 [Ladona fulva]